MISFQLCLYYIIIVHFKKKKCKLTFKLLKFILMHKILFNFVLWLKLFYALKKVKKKKKLNN